MRVTYAVLVTMTLVGCGTAESRDAAKRITLVPASDASADARYSKDGRLAFERVVAGKSAIFVGNADAGNAKRVSFGVWDFAPMWSPDGKSIAFGRDAGLQSDVVIVPADSGPEVVVAGTSAVETPRGWLPDGSGLLFVRVGDRGGEPWVHHVADRSSAKLFDVDGSVGVAPSPDGKWIAYTLRKGGKATIWVWDRATKAHRQLTTEGFESAGLDCFAPDGSRILYESRRTGTSDLWTVDVVSGERRQLTQDVADDSNGQWSPDGTRIAFNSNRGGQPDVWVLSTGESDVQRVTDDVVFDGVLRWTPDGRGIVAIVTPGHQHLFSIPAAGGAAVPLTSGDWDVTAAVLSRDGSRIAYVGTKNGDADIWIVSAAGGASRLVSGAPGSEGGPSFSPDGKHITFTSVQSGNRDIWTVSADSGAAATLKQLTNWPSVENNVQWSPDGGSIAFLSTRESSGADIWIMPAAGGTPRRLTRLGTVAGNFRWSQDGRTIAYAAQAQRAGGGAVFTVLAGGGEPRLLVPPTSGSPEWSPDGRKVAVTKCVRGYCAIEARDLSGALVNSLSPAGDGYEFLMHWSHDGSQVLVVSQDLTTNAANRVFLRPASGGVGRLLSGSLGQALAVGFSAGDIAAIVLGAPYGQAIQQIPVPAAARVP